MKGIIYKYTSPSKKIYIGQTTNELNRRTSFNDKHLKYAGKKMNDERTHYSDYDKWKYEVIYTLQDDDYERLKEKLTFLEAYYIIKFNTIDQGLNTYLADYDNLKNNKYFLNYYKKLDDKTKLTVLNNIKKEWSPFFKEKNMLTNEFWDQELLERDRPKILDYTVESIHKLLKRKKKLDNKEKDRIDTRIRIIKKSAEYRYGISSELINQTLKKKYNH